MVDIAKQHGFDIHDLFGKGRKGTVAVRQHLDRTWSHAALDGRGDQGRQGEQGRFPYLNAG
jgi:hypothetical protein